MNVFKFQVLSLLVVALILNSTFTFASPNAVVDENPKKSAIIKKLISQYILLSKSRHKGLHPIIANKNSRTTFNPFAGAPKSLSAKLAQQGVNLSVLATYNAIYYDAMNLGSPPQQIINTSLNTVLVIGKGSFSRNPIYSLGPVVIEGNPDDLSTVLANNIIWINNQSKKLLSDYKDSTFIGLPLANGHSDPEIIIPFQTEVDRFKVLYQKQCLANSAIAVRQNAQNKAEGCGFIGAKWSGDKQGQLDRCLKVLSPVANAEIRFREESLAQCQVKNAELTSPRNRPDIPVTCHDSSKQYLPVNQINHLYRYTRELKSPVKGGLIRYDYNQDNRDDYVFLEVNDDKARVTLCFSYEPDYQRQLTDIEFYAPGSGSVAGRNYELSQAGDLFKVVIQHHEHNIGSSSRDVSYRYQLDTRKFKIIDNTNDTFVADPNMGMSIPDTPSLF